MHQPVLHYVTAYADSVPAIDLKTHSLLFTHIPKAGGTTLSHILEPVAASSHIPHPRAIGTIYGQFHGAGKGEAMFEFGRLPEHLLHKRAFFFGHLPYGMHRVLSHPYFYVTLLREPTARLLSQYRFGIRRGGWGESSPIAEVIEKGLIVDNLQTRMLAGLPNSSPPLYRRNAQGGDRAFAVGICRRWNGRAVQRNVEAIDHASGLARHRLSQVASERRRRFGESDGGGARGGSTLFHL